MNSSERESLELRADVLRARVLGRVDELERRGKELVSIKDQAVKKLPLLGMIAGGAVLLLGATAGVTFALLHRRRERHSFERKMDALAKIWQRPDRVVQRPSLLGEVARKMLIAAVTIVGQRYLARALKTMELPLTEPPPKQLTAGA